MATVAEALLECLTEWDVQRIYGYPGDGINGIHDAQESMGDQAPPFIQARHEEEAAFMAAAHGKWTGEPGVCMATSGPGAIHLLNGLYDAKLDRSPVVAIVGQQAATAMGGSYQQEVDLNSLFKDVCSDYLVTVSTPQQIPMVVDRAFRTAKGRMAPTCIIIHADVQEQEYVDPPHEFKMVPGSRGYTKPRIIPPEAQLEEAARILNEGERVAILIGQGAAGAADEVPEAAERLGAGVAKALLGKDVLPDTLPYVTGSIGLLGTKPSWDMMMNCDTLLMIGSNLPYSHFLPEWGQARGVQIDISAHNIGLRYPMDVNLIGDAKDTLSALLPKLQQRSDRSWRHEIEQGVADWWKVVEARAHQEGHPVNPQFAFWELNKRLPDDVIITADSGSGTNWFARDLQIRKGMRASLSGTLATMGPAVPYAEAAKWCYPDRPVIACVGDGAMQMIGINALISIAKYW
ncbi:MAG: thiamine pyrophosphate-requiring protein, partial [Actinomycetota bacterium]|nr:thiamine pyrophosphate-requiring protein [Actinomycetota bacterium]